jgi:hypothetical protein
MFVRFDKKSLNVDVLVGVAEEYKPNEEIIGLYNEAQELKESINNYLDSKFATRDQAAILKVLSENKELEDEWKNFLKNDFSAKVQQIQEKIDGINKQGQ